MAISSEYPQLELYVKDAILANNIRRYRKPATWIRIAGAVALGVGIVKSNLPVVLIGALALVLVDVKRSETLQRSLREGDPPVENTPYRIKKMLKRGELRPILGDEICEMLERCATATRRTLSFHAPQTMANHGRPSDEAKRDSTAAEAEMNAAFRLVGRSLMFRLPPDENILPELQKIASTLENLVPALESGSDG